MPWQTILKVPHGFKPDRNPRAVGKQPQAHPLAGIIQQSHRMRVRIDDNPHRNTLDGKVMLQYLALKNVHQTKTTVSAIEEG